MQPGSRASIDLRALGLLAVLTLIWGTNWPLFPLAVREVSVWTFRAIAMPTAGLILLGVARARGQSLAIPREYWPTVGAAALIYLGVWNIASTYAAVLIPSGQAAVLGFTMPLWLALISSLLFRERLGARMLIALTFGALAVTLLMVPNFGAYADAPLGLALGLLSGIGWAGGTLILKRNPVPVPTTVLTAWQMLIISVPIVTGAFLFGDGQWFVPSWPSILVIAYITLVPICLGNVIWFAIVGMLPANVAGLSPIMVPVVALVSGAVVLGEPFGPVQWVAMACCVASLSLALLKPAAARVG
ncbi:MAG TPA: DMT family transporter [Burkholderiaceae bacterium]|nr:DMT family transporter [Burkholderiaceae bacterium]